MTTEIALLLLRILSGGLLLALMAAFFAVMWRDYRRASAAVEVRRRSFGQLVAMREIDGSTRLTGETYPLLPLTSLGRSPSNTITVDNSFASSEHALVTLRDGQWWLEDRHSRNGTTLNDVPITEPVIITQGDIIGIGQMKFRLELE
jgi:hypothetical protein